MNEEKLKASIASHEAPGGKPVLRAYQDSVGVWTAGIGRNLQTMTITQHVADEWFGEDVYAAEVEAKKFPEYVFLDTDARQNVFIEMVFNMGSTRLRNFQNMLWAIRERNWDKAAVEMLNSKWAIQVGDKVGQRAWTMALMMKTGEFQD